eukprot:CAMPEP_0117497742 /NCGR_PEP_ID=MMETSP0784-20121206/21344_1 /TAXON_ID=39447 /ORGANISM="" /LENGTH=33 /DNA_ID= /DNA_START= /DNA_END= /DNA_ORIENTATION=
MFNVLAALLEDLDKAVYAMSGNHTRLHRSVRRS